MLDSQDEGLDQSRPDLRSRFIDTSQVLSRKSFPEGKVINNPDYRTVAEEQLDFLLNKGAFLAFGKPPSQYGTENGEFQIMFTGGQLNALQSSMSALGIAYRAARGHLDSLNNISERDFQNTYYSTVASTHIDLSDHSENSPIWNNIPTSVRAFGDQQMEDEKYRDQARSFLQSVAHGEKGVYAICHAFPSQTRMRGHHVPYTIVYFAPASEGNQFVQDLQSYPWMIEGLSEMVFEKARQDLNDLPHAQIAFQVLNNFSIPKDSKADKILGIYECVPKNVDFPTEE
ncbi:hypothetical protein LRY65_03970 [Candidatus Woesebacteria bacterium]|nr:hypothetical protein [Candidatus Woesebacteria bacterium]MCD8507092.1 hypothetical protein [Candidatus Woesebacteria bacterium]MCD8527339.1 hypothetical protein [Candidatus Woesebacteria bacterium]MCD8546085.1 hypothetical protein [Candidatus Woesebacteria bacterium]